MQVEQLLRRRVDTVSSSDGHLPPFTVGVMRLWSDQKRVEICLIRDAGFSRYLQRYERTVPTPATAASFVFAPSWIRHPMPVGDIFNREEWDLTSDWFEDGMSICSYDKTVSQQERIFILQDLQRFLFWGSNHFKKKPLDRRRYAGLKTCMFTTPTATPPHSTCKWPYAFMVIVNGPSVVTTESTSFVRNWDKVCIALNDATYDVIIQFPWSSCSDESPKCTCMNAMKRTMYRPTLVFDRRFRKDCMPTTPEQYAANPTEEATMWAIEQYLAIGVGSSPLIQSYYPPRFSYMTKGIRRRLMAILDVIQHKLNTAELETDWIMQQLVSHGALLVETTLSERKPALLDRPSSQLS